MLELFHIIMELSSLSFYDMVRIIAQYNTLYSGKATLNDVDLKQRGYTDSMIAVMREKSVQVFTPVDTCGIRIKSDFSKVQYPHFHYLMNLFQMYEKGCLPFPGTVSEQPAQIIEMFNIVQLLELERHNRRAKEQQQGKKK